MKKMNKYKTIIKFLEFKSFDKDRKIKFHLINTFFSIQFAWRFNRTISWVEIENKIKETTSVREDIYIYPLLKWLYGINKGRELNVLTFNRDELVDLYNDLCVKHSDARAKFLYIIKNNSDIEFMLGNKDTVKASENVLMVYLDSFMFLLETIILELDKTINKNSVDLNIYLGRGFIECRLDSIILGVFFSIPQHDNI